MKVFGPFNHTRKGEVLLYFRMMQAYLTTRCTDEDASCTPTISYVSKVDILMSVISQLVSFFHE